MNRIEIGTGVNKDIVLKENSILVFKSITDSFNLSISSDIKLFLYIEDSSLDIDFNIDSNPILNIFSYDSSLNINLNLNEEDICLNYNYSTFNKDNNKYLVNINHNKNNTISKVINNGLNVDTNSLDFIVNAYVPTGITGVITSQKNEIIKFNDSLNKIEPNLYVENDEVEASHSAYIGEFKKEDIFYLASRGINYDRIIKLLSKSFIMGHMDISFIEKNMILEKLDLYWR